MATFITAQTVGNDINIQVLTSTGYWKYNHNSTNSSVFANGSQIITVANANGEFTLIPCLSDGTPSGDITSLNLYDDQITSFDGTGLSSLTYLALSNNQLTTFDGTGLTSLNEVGLENNQLTTFDGTGLSSLTELFLNYNLLTTFDGTGLSGLIYMELQTNLLTTFDGTGLTNLNVLRLDDNQLTSINISGLTVLQSIITQGNPLTPSINNSLLAQLAANELANDWNYGDFFTSGGRTSAGTTDYDYLIANGWNLQGADLVVVSGGKLRIKGATTIG
jgi:Leucine-rich repeat (LRR) protein